MVAPGSRSDGLTTSVFPVRQLTPESEELRTSDGSQSS